MSEERALKILFVVNPNSGPNSRDDKESVIRNHFAGREGSLEFFYLTGSDDTAAMKKLISESHPSKVVAVGGDGTITLVARQLMNTGIALGIIPAGSANGMAKELGIPEDTTGALTIVENGQIKDSDVIGINDQYCSLHLSDIGLNARLIKHFDEGRFRGKLGYASVALKTILRRRKLHVVIKTRDKELLREAVMVVLANATKYGTGAIINPEGNIYDGVFEVVIVKKLSVLFKLLIAKQSFDPSKIEIVHATSVSIKTKGKVHFQVDGEYIGKINRIDARIMPGQLKLIVP